MILKDVLAVGKREGLNSLEQVREYVPVFSALITISLPLLSYLCVFAG